MYSVKFTGWEYNFLVENLADVLLVNLIIYLRTIE